MMVMIGLLQVVFDGIRPLVSNSYGPSSTMFGATNNRRRDLVCSKLCGNDKMASTLNADAFFGLCRMCQPDTGTGRNVTSEYETLCLMGELATKLPMDTGGYKNAECKID